MNVNRDTVLWGLAGVAGAYVLGKWMIKDAGGEVADAVDRNLNPTRDTNLANRAAQGLWDSVTDGQGTIGTDIYEGVQQVKGWIGDILTPDQAGQIIEGDPVQVQVVPPPEASQLPNSWARETPGPSGQYPVSEEQFKNQRVM